MRLIVFSGVVHHPIDDHFIAHAGFVREIDLWAGIFDQVVVLSPVSVQEEKADDIPYYRKNIRCVPLGPAISTDGISGKLRLLIHASRWLKQANKVIQPNDVIMARGPDSVGFLGYIITRWRKNKRFAKYADQWQNFNGEPLGYRLQKMFYRASTFGGLVQIYGSEDLKRPHLVPFFTSSIHRQDWMEAGQLIETSERPHKPFRILFVGRLVQNKGVDLILKAAAQLATEDSPISVTIAGDGPEEENLKSLCASLNIEQDVQFLGRQNWQSLKYHYQTSDVFIHASRKEGFGKVLIEAMCFGLPIIAAEVGVTQALLKPPKFGLVIQSGNVEVISKSLKMMIEGYDYYKVMGMRARKRSESFLLEIVQQQYHEFVDRIMNNK